MLELIKYIGGSLMKQCPNCNKVYRDFDQYCLVCRYKLKYIEGSDKIEYCPEAHDSSYIKQQEPKVIVSCPYCKSTNTKKITSTSKAIHTAIFGIFSIGRNSKQWHCNQCNSDF